jgi:hypothetical protein
MLWSKDHTAVAFLRDETDKRVKGSIGDLETITLMSNALGTTQMRSAAFPLALELAPILPAGWRLRIHVSEGPYCIPVGPFVLTVWKLVDDPCDTGLVIGHDTAVFKQLMTEANREIFSGSKALSAAGSF